MKPEYNDVYDQNRKFTGRTRLRGSVWAPGEMGLVVCIWVYGSDGRILLTRRAPEKCFPGTWENSGGAVKAGENSRQAAVRELREETGIRASEEELDFIDTDRDEHNFYDFYCLKRDVSLSQIVLQPGETDAVQWADFGQIRQMIARGEICSVIGHQFFRQEAELLKRMRQN